MAIFASGGESRYIRLIPTMNRDSQKESGTTMREPGGETSPAGRSNRLTLRAPAEAHFRILDPDGQLASVTDGAGNITTLSYDPAGHPSSWCWGPGPRRRG